MKTADTPDRKRWKHDLASYLEVDRRRSLGQIASVVLPYVGILVLASIVHPNAWLAVGLGLVATVFLALQGSSYLKLPRPLAWAVGNVNYHHVHHLSAKIPNYRLRAAHEEQPMFARTPVVTLRRSIDALRLKLWDEERRSLVRHPALASRATRSAHDRRRTRPSERDDGRRRDRALPRPLQRPDARALERAV